MATTAASLMQRLLREVRTRQPRRAAVARLAVVALQVFQHLHHARRADPVTAKALRAAVAEHNLVRDAFMCRLIIFLRGTDALLKALEIPRYATSKGSDSSLEEMPSSPLGAMEAVRDDPLFYIRSHLQERHECGVYNVPLPRSLDWAACYLSDENVPGTRGHRRKQKEDEALFALLDVGAPAAGRATRKTAKGRK